jgi:hypothetical protein
MTFSVKVAYFFVQILNRIFDNMKEKLGIKMYGYLINRDWHVLKKKKNHVYLVNNSSLINLLL